MGPYKHVDLTSPHLHNNRACFQHDRQEHLSQKVIQSTLFVICQDGLDHFLHDDHVMEMFSTLLALYEENPSLTVDSPHKGLVILNFDIYLCYQVEQAVE